MLNWLFFTLGWLLLILLSPQSAAYVVAYFIWIAFCVLVIWKYLGRIYCGITVIIPWLMYQILELNNAGAYGLSFILLSTLWSINRYNISEVMGQPKIAFLGISSPLKIISGPLSPCFDDPFSENIDIQHRDWYLGLKSLLLFIVYKLLFANIAFEIFQGLSMQPEAAISIYAFLAAPAVLLFIYCDLKSYFFLLDGCCYFVGLRRYERSFGNIFKVTSIPRYWENWNSSFYRFFKECVFLPISFYFRHHPRLGPLIGLTVVFFLTAIWHGLNPPIILFFLLHFFAVILYFLFGRVIAWLGFVGHFVSYIVCWALILNLDLLFVSDSVLDGFHLIKSWFSALMDLVYGNVSSAYNIDAGSFYSRTNWLYGLLLVYSIPFWDHVFSFSDLRGWKADLILCCFFLAAIFFSGADSLTRFYYAAF